LATDCEFPAFVSALLLLNASIFFVLFMNFYIENYNKKLAAAAKVQAPVMPAEQTALPALEEKTSEAKKVE
jgi:hypothetical protein